MEVFFPTQPVTVSATPSSLDINTGAPTVRVYEEREPYEGSYEITPSAETQVLSTNHKRMTGDVTINPIPSNYGLITWNGSVLTVS